MLQEQVVPLKEEATPMLSSSRVPGKGAGRGRAEEGMGSAVGHCDFPVCGTRASFSLSL